MSSTRIDEDLGPIVIFATAENPLDDPITGAADVYAVLRDAKGEIVGGLTSVTAEEEWSPGVSETVLIASDSEVEAVTDADVSVDPETGG